MSRLSVAAFAVVAFVAIFGAFVGDMVKADAGWDQRQQAKLENQLRHAAPGSDKAFKAQLKLDRLQAWREDRPQAGFPDEFARALHDLKVPADRKEPEYRTGYQGVELQKALPFARADKSVVWTSRGPGNVAGRAREILVDPGDATTNTWFVASVGGGVWKTTDAGASWRQLTDEIANLPVSALVQAPSNPNILYAGTGESFYSVDVINGNGILKSTDRGETWTPLASTLNDIRFNNVSRILVSPTDANLVLASTTVGRYKADYDSTSNIFRSTNGGTSWTVVHTETGTGVFGDPRILQLVADPNNFNIQYACVYGGGIRKSTNGGLTWSTINNGISNLTGRFELAISPVNTNYLFASSQGSGHSELWVSWNGGTNWQETFEVGTEPNWLGSQGWYDNTIVCNPFDARIVYVGGPELWQITLASVGSSSRTTSRLASYSWPHPDHHALRIVPIQGGGWYLLNTNDGGVARTTSGATGYTMPVTGMVTTQFYGVDKAPGRSAYFGGTQDNGTWQSGDNPDAVAAYDFRIGGDGYETSWHFDDPLKLIGGYQYNGLQRSLDGGATWESATNGMTNNSSSTAPFITKIAKSQKRPDTIFAVGVSGVWKSTDFGGSWALTSISPANLGSLSSFLSVRVSNANPDIVWAGSRMDANGRINVSTDNGASFNPTSLYPLAVMGPASGLATHPTNANTAYAMFSFSKRPKILRTTDLGANWTDITGYNGSGVTSSNGFPDVAVYDLVVWPNDTNRLWAATEIGIVESLNGGASWALANYNLPAVGVWRLTAVEDEIIAGTHGRGIWSMTDTALEAGQVYRPLFDYMVQPPSGALGLQFNLRSVYDSTQVWINGAKVQVVGPNTRRQSVSLTVPVMASGLKTAFARSFKGGIAYDSVTRSLNALALAAPSFEYVSSLNSGADFDLTQFSILTPGGFTDPALHTTHDYTNGAAPVALLKTPIVIAENTTLTYNEIAIVEPGDPGAVFGETSFWDYVVVEGSRDGITWLPVAPGIDAQSDPSWLNSFYSGSPAPSESLFRAHQTVLNDTFAKGETILLRFRLFSDSAVTGWGWAIDDISIQATTGATPADGLPAAMALAQNHPNPFNPSTTIAFSLVRDGRVELKVFDARGALVRTLLDGAAVAGEQRVVWDGRDNSGRQSAAGVYLYRLRADGRELQRKMTLVK
ncbi:MAG: hypothetical protein IPI48_14750 [bacterium]|nr:hypothetical protein [bacterium]